MKKDSNPLPLPLLPHFLRKIPGFLLFTCLFLLGSSVVQAQFYEWAFSLSGPGPNVGQRVALDQQGNIYSAGEFADSVDFDPGPGTAWVGGTPGASRSYLASYDADGNLNWAFRVADRSPFSTARTLFTDASGSVYIGGSFFGLADFDPSADSLILGNPILPFTYLAKYSQAGALIWVQVFNSNFVLTQGKTTPGGDFVLTGYFSGTVNFNPSGSPVSLSSNGLNDMVLASYENNGTLKWAQRLGGSGEDLANDLAVSPAGDIVLAGTFSNTVQFDPSGTAQPLSSQGDWDFVLARYSSSGQYLWAKAIGGPARQQQPLVDMGPDGTLTLAGYYRGTVDFNPGTGTNPLTSDANGDGFLARYDSNGDFRWVNNLPALNALFLGRVKVDTKGKIILAGFFDSAFQTDPNPGGRILNSNGDTDAFIALYNPRGRHISSAHFGNTSSDGFLDVALDAENHLFPCGLFTGMVDFDPGPDQALLSSLGSFDIVVSKYASCRTDWVSTAADSGAGSLREVIANACEGATIHFDPSLAGDTIRLTSGEIFIDKDLHIQGLGKESLFISGNQTSRIFYIDSAISISIADLTLTQGLALQNGGAISSQGALHLSRVDLINNTASRPLSSPANVSPEAFGGAIYSAAPLIMEDCRLEGNRAEAMGGTALVRSFGGAITCIGNTELIRCTLLDNEVISTSSAGLPIGFGGAIFSSNMIELTECVIENNRCQSQNLTSFSSSLGGALYNLGVMEIHRSLFHQNSCLTSGTPSTTGFGGGIYNEGILNIENSTFSENSVQGSGATGAAFGGGIYNTFTGVTEIGFSTLSANSAQGSNAARAGGIYNAGALSLEAVILAGNLAPVGPDAQNQRSMVSMGHNLIGDTSQCRVAPTTGDIFGNALSPANPQLGPLADNGGFSASYALQAGSPAIDAGPSSGPQTDQRGYFRPAGAHRDIGAIESAAEPLIWIADPLEGDTFPYLADISVLAKMPSSEFSYLKVTCPDNSFRKLQIANNPVSKWGPKVNVVAGGNDSLKLVLRDPNGDTDWNKIRFYPDGITAQPVNLALYLPPGGVGPDWTTVNIPLSAFSSSINFANLGYLEFPFSQQAGPFELHVREISFVGGTTPFLYFGEGKTDNQQNGTGGPGKLFASLQAGETPKIVPDAVDFFANGLFIGRDSTAPFTARFKGDPAGDVVLTARALLADGSWYTSEPVNITVETPEVVIVSPADSAVFVSPASIPLSAEVRGVAGDLGFLQVISPDNNYRKLKLSHNPFSLYTPKVDVTAGGNTHLEVTLRDPKGNVDWHRIEIHPEGNLNNPVKIGDYLPAGGPGTDWFSISIPLTDFDPSINFTSISWLELPYSVKAGPFEIHLGEVKFTGGSTPFLWLGEGKLDNDTDGNGGPGQLVANVVSGSLEVVAMDFYANGNFLGTDSVAPFGINWVNPGAGTYLVTAVATLSNGTQITSQAITVEVRNTPRLAGIQPASGVIAYPNPALTHVKVEFSQEEKGSVQLSLSDLAGKTWFRQAFASHEGKNVVDLDLTGLPSGMYVLTVENEDSGGKAQVKVVKQ